jgi:hypothetical protein
MRRALLLAVALAACSEPRAPSAEYAEARRRHAGLVASRPADAAALPEMDDVVALLARVPASSADAEAAAELRGRIDAERRALAAEQDRRRQLVERAAAPVRVEAPAAAPVAADGPFRLVPGMKLAEFRARAGDCFVRKGDVELVEGEKKRAAEVWGLATGSGCAERHPAQVGQLIVFADDAYVTVRPEAAATTRVERKTETRREERVERIEVVPLPEGGYGRLRPDGKTEPLPKGATLKLEAPPPAAPTRAAAQPTAAVDASRGGAR